jgi:hypothetical protein
VSSVNDSRLIDENDLPFTEDELYRGFALLHSEQDAREGARLIAEILGPGDYQGGWSIRDETFAALALVSDDLRDRVEAYMRAPWEASRQGLINAALRRDGLSTDVDPTPAALRAADEEIAGRALEWQRKCVLVTEWVRRRQAGEVPEDEPPPWEEELEE